jgi:hypothetical protein
MLPLRFILFIPSFNNVFNVNNNNNRPTKGRGGFFWTHYKLKQGATILLLSSTPLPPHYTYLQIPYEGCNNKLKWYSTIELHYYLSFHLMTWPDLYVVHSWLYVLINIPAAWGPSMCGNFCSPQVKTVTVIKLKCRDTIFRMWHHVIW